MSLEVIVRGNEQQRKVSAIKLARRLGRVYSIRRPDIAEMFRQGLTHLEIAVEIGLYRERGGVTKRVAEEAVYYSLHGHPGGYGINSYPGLMSREELREIDSLRRKTYLRKAGSASAAVQKKERIGIFGLSSRQKSEAGKRGAEKSLKVQGITPWIKGQGYLFDEIACAYLLSIHPSYQFQEGINKGKPNCREIANLLNEIYHNNEEIRTKATVTATLHYYRKAKGY